MEIVANGDESRDISPPPPFSHKGAKPELKALTSIRFVAAFYIFLFHIQIRWPVANHRFTAGVLEQGAVAMSLFFVLSGFILAYQYAESQVSFHNYFKNRLSRIYPIYLTVAIITIPWLHSGGSTMIRSIFHGIVIVMINIFMLQAWFPQFFPLWNDGGSWSISVEIFCSFLLPFFLVYFQALSHRAMQLASLIAYCLAILPGLVVMAFGDQAANVFYSSPIYRLPEFLLGACMFFVARRIDLSSRYWEIPVCVAIGLVVLYLGFYGSAFTLYVTHDWIVLPAVALSLVVLSQSRGWLAKFMSCRVMTYGGRISYCFYSFQLLLLLVLVHDHDRIVRYLPVMQNARILLVVSFGLLVVVSSAGHHLIEEPARWLKKSHWPFLPGSLSSVHASPKSPSSTSA